MPEIFKFFNFFQWNTERQLTILIADIAILIIGCVTFGLLTLLGFRINSRLGKSPNFLQSLGVITIILIFIGFFVVNNYFH